MNNISYLTLAEQVYNDIANKINEDIYPAGSTIPGELKLSETYGVSRVTVRNAIDKLVDDGYLIKRKGKGTFVRQKQTIVNAFANGSFSRNCQLLGVKPSSHIISCKVITATQNVADDLGCDTNEVIEMKRVRYIGDDPCIVEIDYFPKTFDFLLTSELGNGSLIDFIYQNTKKASLAFIDEYRIVNAGEEFAQWLSCKNGTPLLEVNQKVLTANDQILYINKQYILTSKYVYAVRSSNDYQ